MEDLNVIKTIKIGNATIYVCDNSFVKTKEEERSIIETFSAAAYELCKKAKEVS